MADATGPNARQPVVRAVGRMLRVSPQKLNLVAREIRGLPANDAFRRLSASRKRAALHVRKVLDSAVANAENNFDLDVDELVVDGAWVGKNMVLRRGRPRARGRFGTLQKPFSQITITVRERDGAEGN